MKIHKGTIRTALWLLRDDLSTQKKKWIYPFNIQELGDIDVMISEIQNAMDNGMKYVDELYPDMLYI